MFRYAEEFLCLLLFYVMEEVNFKSRMHNDKRVSCNNGNSCKCNHCKLFQLFIKRNGNKILIV